MKKFRVLFYLFLGIFFLAACNNNAKIEEKKEVKISNEDMIDMWTSAVDKYNNFLLETQTKEPEDKNYFPNQVKKIEAETKSDIKKLEQSTGDEKLKKDLINFDKQLIKALNNYTKQTNNEPMTPEEEEAPFLMGQKLTSFAQKYTDNILPDSVTILQNTLQKQQDIIDQRSKEYQNKLEQHGKNIDDLQKKYDDANKKVKDAFSN